jgi:hypothetical protein
LSLRRFGFGKRGSINSHCASVNCSNRFLLIQAVQQITTHSISPQLEATPIYETRSMTAQGRVTDTAFLSRREEMNLPSKLRFSDS